MIQVCHDRQLFRDSLINDPSSHSLLPYLPLTTKGRMTSPAEVPDDPFMNSCKAALAQLKAQGKKLGGARPKLLERADERAEALRSTLKERCRRDCFRDLPSPYRGGCP